MRAFNQTVMSVIVILISNTCVNKKIGLITVLAAILTGKQSVENLQYLYGDPMSDNIRKTSAQKNL